MSVVNTLRASSQLSPQYFCQFFLFPEKCTLTWKLTKHNIPFMFTVTHFRQLEPGNSINTFPSFSYKNNTPCMLH